MTITEPDSSFSQITADTLKTAMIAMYEASGLEAEITDRYFKTDKVCGLPAYQYCFDVTLAGVDMTQIMVSVDADKTYTFNYTATSADWISAFENSAKNITLTLE